MWIAHELMGMGGCIARPGMWMVPFCSLIYVAGAFFAYKRKMDTRLERVALVATVFTFLFL